MTHEPQESSHVKDMLDIQRYNEPLYIMMPPAVQLGVHLPAQISSTGSSAQRSPASDNVQFIPEIDMKESVRRGENFETSDCHVPFNSSTSLCSSARALLDAHTERGRCSEVRDNESAGLRADLPGVRPRNPEIVDAESAVPLKPRLHSISSPSIP